MIVKSIMDETLPNVWPIVLFVCVEVIALRLAYLHGSRRFILYKELLTLMFIIYILCLYYIVSWNDIHYGGVNLVPFVGMFKYDAGSYTFMKNILAGIILFIPYGYFSSYYLNSRHFSRSLVVTLVTSLCIELIQYYSLGVFEIDDVICNIFGGFLGYLIYVVIDAVKGRLPRFMRSDAFINFLLILIIIIFVILGYRIDILSYI